RCWVALQESASAQAKHQIANEPTARYLDLLRASLSSGRAHLEARSAGAPPSSPRSCGWRLDAAGKWLPLGDCVGWVDGDDVYLQPAASYRIVQVAGRDVGEVLAVTEQTLKKRLAERGLLASRDAARETITVRKRIGGCARDVLHFHRSTLLPDQPDG